MEKPQELSVNDFLREVSKYVFQKRKSILDHAYKLGYHLVGCYQPNENILDFKKVNIFLAMHLVLHLCKSENLKKTNQC